MTDHLFDVAPLTIEALAEPDLSYGQRLTIRRRLAIEQGRHPANGLPINTTHSCGECEHLNRYDYHRRRYLKCEFHALGESHSEASDMRASWPACPHFKLRADDPQT